MNEKHKKRLILLLPYIIAFSVTFLSMLMIFIGRGIYPFGERSFLRTDLFHQYAPFFQEFKDKLSSGESLLYTWDIGLGTNFLSIFGYYLSSPLNWFIFLCPRSHVIEFITYGIVLKMALSSTTMTLYLNYHNRTSSSAAAFFGIFYGLSGYMAAYSWNIMWLDCMILLPVIFIGLERLVKEHKGFLYCIALGLTIISNYYIAIMICISCTVYFIVLFILERGEAIDYPKRILNFIMYSFLAGGLAAIILLPEISALSYTASGKISFPSVWQSYFSMFDMIARHLLNVNVEIGLDHWPNIYCGVAVLLFVPLYFMNSKVSFKEKTANICLVIFFYMSFSVNALNFIWHGFHYPNSLPARQSFVYIFFILAMCYRGFTGLRERSVKQITSVLVFAVLFIIAAEKLEATYTGRGDDMYYMWFSFYLSILFVIIYALLSYFWRRYGKRLKYVLMVCTLIAILIEATVNMSYTSVTTYSRTVYTEYDENTRTLTAQAKEEDNGFYRIEKVKNRTKNDGAWLDYKSASIFSSTAYADLTAFYKKIGLESSTNAYGTKGSTLASNMLLGIRYSLYTQHDTKPDENDEFRTLFASTDNIDMYRNACALSLGFTVPAGFSDSCSFASDDPGVNWNNFTHALGISKDLFIPLTVTNNNTSAVTVTALNDGYYAFYSAKSGPAEIRVSYGDTSTTFDDLGRSYFMSLNYQTKDTVFTFSPSDTASSQSISLTAYRIDENVLREMYDILSSAELQIDSYTQTSVTGHVNVSENSDMICTIPYDKGWSVKIDGEPVEAAAFADAFISFSVSAGEHTIELSYTPDGLYMGIAISAISVILLVMIWFLISLYKRRQAQEALLEENGENSEDGEETDAASDEAAPVETADPEALNNNTTISDTTNKENGSMTVGNEDEK